MAPGGVEGNTEYQGEYEKKKGERADYINDNDFLTPYGDLAGKARKPGHPLEVK